MTGNISRAGGATSLGFGWGQKKECSKDGIGNFLFSARYLSEYDMLANVRPFWLNISFLALAEGYWGDFGPVLGLRSLIWGPLALQTQPKTVQTY